MTNEPRIALVTGATQGLGQALVEGLSNRLDTADVVYLTGRNKQRIEAAAAALADSRADVRPEVLDVGKQDDVEHLAAKLADRHGGIDIVYSNAVMRVQADDPVEDVVREYANVNNFGTTRILRSFMPLIRDGGRMLVVASSLGTLDYLAPLFHDQFDGVETLDEIDANITKWRDAVEDGSARGSAWPGFINIPSKIGQVAAVRALAGQRRKTDLAKGILLASLCPGMMNTPTSGAFWDVSDALSPAEAAVPLIDVALHAVNDSYYGELIRDDEVLLWAPWRS